MQLPSVRKFSYAQKLVEFGIMSRLQSFHFHVPQRKKKEGINYDKRKNRIAFTLNLYLVLISRSYTTNLNIALKFYKIFIYNYFNVGPLKYLI